jgi:TPR repeat protein
MKHLLLIAVITAISSVLAVDCSVWEKYFDKNDTTPFRKVFSDILKAFNTNKLSEVGVILRSEAPNNVRAQYLLGCYYIIQQQDQEGFLWLNKAAKQNYLPAKLYLLQLYAWKQSSPTFLKKY